MFKLKQDDLRNNSIVLFALMMTANVCNYAFQVVVGNLLSKTDYGTVNSILSLIVVLGAPSGLFTVMSSRYTTQYLTRGEKENAASFIVKLEKASAILGAAVLAVGAAFSGVMSKTLKLDSRALVLACLGTAAIGYLIPVLSGALQGSKKFVSYGLTSVIASVCKLGGSVLFILAGIKIYGVVFSVFTGSLLVTLFSVLMLRGLLSTRRRDIPIVNDPGMRKYFLHALLIQVCNTLLANGDTLLIKAYVLNPDDVGVYSSGMLIGKISIYLVSAIVGVLFPLVSEAATQNKDTKKLLLRSILYGGGAALTFAVFLNLFGEFVLNMLFFGKYNDAIPLLLPISFFVVPIALITILMNYQLALGHTTVFSGSMLCGFVLILALVSQFHSSIPQMLYIMGSVLFAVFAVNFVWILTRPSANAANR